jgi:hypothetical protein
VSIKSGATSRAVILEMMEFVVSVILYRLWAAAVAAMHRPYWEPVLKAFAAAGADYNRVNRRGDSALDLRLDLLSSDLQLVERSVGKSTSERPRNKP